MMFLRFRVCQMSLLKRIFHIGEKPGTNAYRRRMAEEMNGLAIRYVTERRNGNDDVIGRNGHLSLRGNEFTVYSSGKVLLRADVVQLDASRLMSGDGVILSAPNIEEGGKIRTITVHYVYHRR